MGIEGWELAAAWTEASATVLAFGAATYAGLAARNLLRVERERDRRSEAEAAVRQAEAIARQAELVSAWVGEADFEVWRPMEGKTYGRGPAVWVRNGGNQPVYNVRVTLASEPEPLKKFPVIAPLAEHSVRLDDGQYGDIMHAWEDGHPAGPRIEFRDTAGREWLRAHDGRLARISDRF